MLDTKGTIIFSAVTFLKYLPMQKLLIAACCLILLNNLYGQRFGGTPPSVKWKQINTDTARVIFPAVLDSQAQRVASLVH